MKEEKVNSKAYKILLVEDNNLTNKLITNILEKNNYKVVVAVDGLQAIDMVETENPDVVLTDILLPMKNGLEIIDFVNKNKPDIPLIAISGYGEEENTVVEAFKLGADDFIGKPFSPNELLARIERLLKDRE
ncbi:response regulator [Mesonia sp. K7]|nr:response regulator [Mesonia sp. K7]